MVKLRTRSSVKPLIPTASMGDIAFLIIIFFMTSTVFNRDKGLKLLLPEKTDKEILLKVMPENIVMITINPAGQFRITAPDWDPERVYELAECRQIRTVVEERLRRRDTLLVVSIRASDRAPYRGVIAVLDQIKMARARLPDGREIEAKKISLLPTKEES